MSQKVSRKTTVGDEKSQEKRRTDSPAKDVKKKMSQTEKEKQNEKVVEKAPEKNASVSEKKESKNDRVAEKKEQKSDKVEKKEAQEKPKEDTSKGEKSNKQQEKPDEKTKKPDQSRPKQNGNPKPHNGVTDVTLSNGNGNGAEDLTGDTVSGDSDDDVMLVISDQEQDELFPELTYDDSEDFEPPTPENRSLTRRSQVKSTRTPETPRPNSDKQTDNDDSKVLKLKDDVSTERKLRSSDSPKPETKKQEPGKKTLEKPVESKKTDKAESKDGKAQENAPKCKDNKVHDEKENAEKSIVEVVVEDAEGNTEERRKADTNFSKSRVKVSPYRRSIRVADQTTTSITANYTGNNTTMEMDITESSIAEEATVLNDSAYLSGLRSISARKSYKPLNDLNIRPIVRTAKLNASVTSVSNEGQRPTGAVVGRKRRQASTEGHDSVHHHHQVEHKRPRLIDRIPLPFRNHRAQQIVGINTDLPLSAPVVAVDPETLKTTDTQTVTQTESKRCIIM